MIFLSHVRSWWQKKVTFSIWAVIMCRLSSLQRTRTKKIKYFMAHSSQLTENKYRAKAYHKGAKVYSIRRAHSAGRF